MTSILQELVEYLKEKGHSVEIVDTYHGSYSGARVQAVAVDKNGIVTANNDRRKEGEVAGF